MDRERDIPQVGQRWRGWATITLAIIGLLTLFGIGNYVYEAFWHSKVLTYYVPPSLDSGDRVLSRLVLENRGRVHLTDLKIVFADLETHVKKVTVPGLHEPIEFIIEEERYPEYRGGHKEFRIEMERFSKGAPPLEIYMEADAEITLREQEEFLISTAETTAVPFEGTLQAQYELMKPVLIPLVIVILILVYLWHTGRIVFMSEQ